MMAVMRLLIALLLVAPMFAADPPGFGLWRAAELERRNETLADYGDHRFRFIHRDADGFPEQHDNIVDVVFVQSGEGALLLGGKMLNLRATGGAGEYVGTGIEGGERHPLGTGDVIHIPATIPHSFLVPKGKHITYVLVKFQAVKP
jgi:hypothetical protein